MFFQKIDYQGKKKLVCCLPKSLVIREKRKPQNNSQESNFITLSGLSESFEVNSWVEVLEGRFLDEKLPFLHKTKTEHSFELYLSIFCPLQCIFNAEMQNSGLKTTTWWSRGSHFSPRFPDMVKLNIQEHWTRVKRFNPLWVSACT